MNHTLQQLRALPHISVSSLTCFVRCPRQHRLKYIDRAAPAFRPVALAFGTAWHDTIGQLLAAYRDGRPVPDGELHRHLRDGIVRQVHADGVPVLFDDDEDEGALVDKAMQMLDVFIADVPMPERVLEIERAFSVELYAPETGEALAAPLIGAVDAVVIEQGRPVIWELKTGKRRWTADQLTYDHQPTAYLLAMRQQGLEEPTLKLVLTTKAARPQVQVEPVVRTSADEDDLANVAAGVLRAVEAGVDHPIRGWQCRGCPYAGDCR